MSVSNYKLIQPILGTDCVGDSLVTINANYSSLEQAVLTFPIQAAGPGVVSRFGINEQGRPVQVNAVNNSFAYFKSFDTQSYLLDNRTIPFDDMYVETTVFPYVSTQQYDKPFGTFTSITPNGKSPSLTLYWTASGENSSTIFATNSAASLTNQSLLSSFNGPINALYASTVSTNSNLVYVGGSFTSPTSKFAIFNTYSGTTPLEADLGRTGSVVIPSWYNQLMLGEEGSVNTITEYNKYIGIGGSFNNPETTLRGLAIVNTEVSKAYHFYTNGVVNSIVYVQDEDGNNCFIVGGDFDFIDSASIDPIFTKGLAKIILSDNNSPPRVDYNFTSNVNGSFTQPNVRINSLLVVNKHLYIGGEFAIKTFDQYYNLNLAVFDSMGRYLNQWKSILNGPVHTLYYDSPANVLYVGGAFSEYYTSEQYYASPRPLYNKYSNVVAFDVTIPRAPVLEGNWTPLFDGPVYTITADDAPGGYVYCQGAFNNVNGLNVGHVGVVIKATNQAKSGKTADLRINLEQAPSPSNTAFLYYSDQAISDSLLIGGNFTKINYEPRYYLARTFVASTTRLYSLANTVTWDFGGQPVANGTFFGMDRSTASTVRVTVESEPFGYINVTKFPRLEKGFEGLQPGQLCQFFIRRPGNSYYINDLKPTDDSYTNYVQVLGWTLDFNN